jgi:hypothetical protein
VQAAAVAGIVLGIVDNVTFAVGGVVIGTLLHGCHISASRG